MHFSGSKIGGRDLTIYSCLKMGNLVSNAIGRSEVLSEDHPMISTESLDDIPCDPSISCDEGESVLLVHPFVKSLLIDDANHEDKLNKRIVMAISSFDVTKTLLQYSRLKEEDRNGNLRDLQDHGRVEDELTRVRKRELIDNDGNDLDIKEEMKYVVAGTISSSSDMNMNNSQSLPCVTGNECLNHSGDDLFGSSTDKQNGSNADDEELLTVPEKEDEEQKKRNSSTSSTTSVRWITHYNSSQKILLVGEGDFSFSACLANAFGSASNMVATSLDSEVLDLFNHKYPETLDRRLPNSSNHILDLMWLGCLVLHEIDVHFMASAHSELVSMKFDRIIFNFPHAGHWRKLREEDFELIRRHKELLSGFFRNSRKLLMEDGEVHVAHRDDYPYNTWEIEKLAKKAGLFLIEKVKFRPEDYPSYSNKRGSRIKCWDSFGFGNFPMTFKFSPVKK